MFTNYKDKFTEIACKYESLIEDNENLLKQVSNLKSQLRMHDTRATENLNEFKASKQKEISDLKLLCEETSLNFNKQLKLEVDKQVSAKLESQERDIRIVRKELRTEFEGKVSSAEKRALAAEGQSQHYFGLYEGSTNVIKTLQGQLVESNATVKLLTTKLPSMDVNVTSPKEISSTVNL